MYTLYGKEAQNGDFVLVQDLAYMKGSSDILVAQVHDGKAYAASAVRHKYTLRRWLRKESAIIIIPESEVTNEERELIKLNIAATKSTFEVGTEYSTKVLTLINAAHQARAQIMSTKYDTGN